MIRNQDGEYIGDFGIEGGGKYLIVSIDLFPRYRIPAEQIKDLSGRLAEQIPRPDRYHWFSLRDTGISYGRVPRALVRDLAERLREAASFAYDTGPNPLGDAES
jgi:hypothetical protein